MILKGFVSNDGISDVAYDSVSKDLKFNYTPQKADVSPIITLLTHNLSTIK